MNKISFVQTQKSSRRYTDSKSFAFNQKGRLPFLQKFIFWILSKLKCNALYDQFTYQQITIDPKSIMESISRQHKEILSLGHHTAGKIYIGPEEMDRLGYESDFSSPVSFSAPYYHKSEIYGMKIIVVPWLQGIFVAPQDKYLGP